MGVNSLVYSEQAEGGRQPIPLPIDGVGPGQHRVQANINRQGKWLKNPQPREKVFENLAVGGFGDGGGGGATGGYGAVHVANEQPAGT